MVAVMVPIQDDMLNSEGINVQFRTIKNEDKRDFIMTFKFDKSTKNNLAILSTVIFTGQGWNIEY